MTPRAPSHLSKEAKLLWRKINTDFEIDDHGALLILQTCLEAFDRMRQSQSILDAEGLTLEDRFGQAKPHPMCIVERDSRSAMLQALKQLGLDIETVDNRPGRPLGGTHAR